MLTEAQWLDATRRNARSVQTLIGWTFWDPGALARYEVLGVPGPYGYVASRCAPLAPAGPDAVIAAFGSISPAVIRHTFELVGAGSSFESLWEARDAAVLEGLAAFASSVLGPLEELGPALWPVVENLSSLGRTFFAAHLRMPRPADPVLSGWHAVNCLREWRGDTHWALVAGEGLSGPEASVLHNAWLGYEPDWIPISRGTSSEDLDAAWEALAGRGLAAGRTVNASGLALRQDIEDRTDALCMGVWRRLGEAATTRFPDEFEPGCALLLRRVDVTAGPNYQPASRIRLDGHRHSP
ncbi:MAG TPA: hypothetical protein VMU64_12690 [Acidimicrobiales bacterium]|nr:hypothetical protein [Acidimicrobiales bacterium]